QLPVQGQRTSRSHLVIERDLLLPEGAALSGVQAPGPPASEVAKEAAPNERRARGRPTVQEMDRIRILEVPERNLPQHLSAGAVDARGAERDHVGGLHLVGSDLPALQVLLARERDEDPIAEDDGRRASPARQ